MNEVPRHGTAAEVGRFLEIQNLGLNLPIALAFLLVAARGLPSLWVFALVVIAFVAARNAGHSFNRWVDREQDRENPRTQHRALVTGRLSGRFSLAVTAANGLLLFVAAFLLNPLALALAPVALGLILGYSLTKRMGWGTTVYLGLVEAITPAAAFVAVRDELPWVALVAVAGMLAWGTAFETVHSLGDLEADRQLGNATVPTRFGARVSARVVVGLHATALVAFAGFGLLADLGGSYLIALAAMAVVAGITDADLLRRPNAVRTPFRRHMLMGAVFFLGVAVALFGPAPIWPGR